MSDLEDVPESVINSYSPKWGKLLTAQEVATYLQCHVSTVYELVNRGRLQALSLTGNINANRRGKKGLRIVASSVDDLVTKGVAELMKPVEDDLTSKEEAEAVLPAPRKPSRPAPTRGSRVILPYPTESR